MKGRPVWVCDAVRTPIGRYGGSLSSVRTDELAALPLKALLERNARLTPASVDDVVMGCANQAGEDSRNVGRQAALLAGLPVSVPGVTVNRLCGSGLQAVLDGARALACGDAEVVLAGGVESMSRAPYVLGKAPAAFDRGAQLEDSTIGWRFVNPRFHARFGTDPMPITAETVARERQISRADQDAFAWRSQRRAAAAVAKGRLSLELLSVPVQGRGGTQQVGADEQPRPESSLEGLARLKPAFLEGGTVTAGNSSGVNDGAAAVLLASDDAVQRFGLTPLARVVAGAVVGVEPRVMGLGPVPAVRALLARTGWRLGEVDVIELNEAFAAQALACLRELGLPDDAEHVNPNGGAIALGHPLGMSGARLVGTAALELRVRGATRALVTMCIGVGQGIALALERAA